MISGFVTIWILIIQNVQLNARVVQHEIDHLNGIIFLDKISDYNSLGFRDELMKNQNQHQNQNEPGS